MAGAMSALLKEKQKIMFELLDRDNDGVISVNEFNRVLSVSVSAVPGLKQIRTNSLDDFFKNLDEHLMTTFKLWDDDHNGSLTWSELQNHGFEEIEIKYFLGALDKDQDKAISKEEFLMVTYEKMCRELRAKKENSEIMEKFEEALKFLNEFSSDLPEPRVTSKKLPPPLPPKVKA